MLKTCMKHFHPSPFSVLGPYPSSVLFSPLPLIPSRALPTYSPHPPPLPQIDLAQLPRCLAFMGLQNAVVVNTGAGGGCTPSPSALHNQLQSVSMVRAKSEARGSKSPRSGTTQ